MQPSELNRMPLFSRVWEPAGEELLRQLPSGDGMQVLDAGCGAMSWLRLLSRWVGGAGHVVGSDVDNGELDAARTFCESERLVNVELVRDDLFNSNLPAAAFDLVHARFLLAPLGAHEEQLQSYRRLLRAGGWLVLEDRDSSSWHYNPPAPAAERLVALIIAAFRAAGRNFDSGRELFRLMRSIAIRPTIRAAVVALEPGHPYLQLPLLFNGSLEPRMRQLAGADGLDALREEAAVELSDPDRWGTTFTLVQAFGQLPS